jgi:PadR family transcriptional regulator, regulatory protein PadR
MKSKASAIKRASPLQFLILLLLTNGPKYGYKILTTIQEDLGEHWEIKSGTLYPTLRSLERQKIVSTSTINEKDFYHLTEYGKSIVNDYVDRFREELDFTSSYFQVMLKYMSPNIQLKLIEGMLEYKPKLEMIDILDPVFKDPLLIEKKIKLIDQLLKQAEDNIILLKRQKQQLQNSINA